MLLENEILISLHRFIISIDIRIHLYNNNSLTKLLGFFVTLEQKVMIIFVEEKLDHRGHLLID